MESQKAARSKAVASPRCARQSRKHEFEKGFELKTQQVYFIYPFPRRLKLEKSLETCCINFFSLELTFKREKPVFWKASFLQNKDWLRVQASCTRLRDW